MSDGNENGIAHRYFEPNIMIPQEVAEKTVTKSFYLQQNFSVQQTKF